MIIIEQPKSKKPLFEHATKIFSKFSNKEEWISIFQKIQKHYSIQKYATWRNDVKYAKFENITPEEAWWIILMQRFSARAPLPIKDEKNHNFYFWELPRYKKFFHDFDSLCGGEILSTYPFHKNTFIQNGELEESIFSSKIEGAVTTISVAKKMLKEKRKPRNKDEQMIQNNYQTMQRIRNEWVDEEMSLELLFKMHVAITEHTDIEEEAIGRLRKNSDSVKISNDAGEIAHIPPNEHFLEKHIQDLVDFANNKKEDEDSYLHPLVKAIVLHFWVGFLHPFVDGNGRLARSLFYWYLLKHKYWAIPFLPISSKIIKSPGQYRDAFLLTEQVHNDFNYFFEYNMRQIQLSMNDFLSNLEKVRREKDYINILMKKDLNERQAELLAYFLIKPQARTTINIHKDYHQISYLTARSDLMDLEKKRFLYSKKSGKSNIYFAKKEAIEENFS